MLNHQPLDTNTVPQLIKTQFAAIAHTDEVFFSFQPSYNFHAHIFCLGKPR